MNIEYYVTSVVIYVLLMAYLIWRVKSDVKYQRPLGQTATWLIYLIPYGVAEVIGWFITERSRTVSIILLVVWVIACGTISYKVHSKYNKWLDEQREKEKYQR